jgi:benzoylformate decarboxylase
MVRMAGRRAIMNIFQAEGVEYIFGNPGTTELGFIDILRDFPNIRYILALHEGVALGMAHMYANASGKTGVVNLHVAPGLGNALGMLYNAAVGKMPLVVTAGQQDTRILVREPLLSYDLVAMARPLCKWAVELRHTSDIPVVLPRAFKVAQDPPRGPVFISLPHNVLDDEADLALPAPQQVFRRMRPDPEGLAAAADLLAAARKPAIICGDGVAASQAQAALVRLAEALGAPVWGSLIPGAVNFPMSHELYRGQLTGEYAAIQRALGEADVVLAVGAGLFPEVFYSPGAPLPDGCRLIQIDDGAWEIGKNLPASVGLLADPRLALEELLEAVTSRQRVEAGEQAGQRREALALLKRQENERLERRQQEKWDGVPISPARLMAELRLCLPEGAVIYNESITAAADVMRTLPLDRPGSYFGNHGGGIGQGLPGALGVKLALPDRPVIAIVGDGSAMYTIQSFWTAAHHSISVVYLILSNRSYRILKFNLNRYRRLLGLSPESDYPHMDLAAPPLDFVRLAEGMGLKGRRVTEPSELGPALQEALGLGGPYVLEVVTEGRGPGE